MGSGPVKVIVESTESIDSVGTEVRASLVPTTGYVATSAIDVRGTEYYELRVTLDDQGSITEINCKFESNDSVQDNDDDVWAFVQAEGSATSGEVEISDYVQTKTGLTTDGETILFRCRAVGCRMRAYLKSDSATGLISARAYRR